MWQSKFKIKDDGATGFLTRLSLVSLFFEGPLLIDLFSASSCVLMPFRTTTSLPKGDMAVENHIEFYTRITLYAVSVLMLFLLSMVNGLVTLGFYR